MPESSKQIYYRCAICDGRAWFEKMPSGETVQTQHCLRCGEYKVNPSFRLHGRKAGFTETQIANASGYIAENPGTIWSEETLADLQSLATPTVAEKAGRLLHFAKTKSPIAGEPFALPVWGISRVLTEMGKIQGEAFPTDPEAEKLCEETLPLLSAAWAQSQSEVHYLLFRVLMESGYLAQGPADGWLEVTPQGWDFLERRPEIAGKACFVAMSFDSSLSVIYSGPISTGIREAGYIPFRVDNKEHNNDITDEILSEIRRAKFVLADFTFQRGGVYYEAGFAAGLGKPVIRTVREDEVKNLHFDTRQLNHIRWNPKDLQRFSKAITNRIVATIGEGPIRLTS